MDQTRSETSPKRRAKFIVGDVILVLALVGLVAWAMNRSGATSFYLDVSELQAQGQTAGTQDYRVGGNVVADSLHRDGLTTTFDISDGSSSVTIVTDETLPDAFWTAYENDPGAVEVVAQGRYDGERFAATQVLAKCPSKFKAKV